MNVNVFDTTEKRNATVRIVADDPRMEEMLEAVLSFAFVRQDRGAAISVVCCTGEAPRITGPCIYVGLAPEMLTEEQIVLPRPLDIERLCREAEMLCRRRTVTTELGWGADRERSVATFGEKEVSLTRKEMELYLLFLSSAGKCVTRERIEKEVFSESGSNAADVYVCYLRKKLESISSPGVLISVRGQGYILKKA